jgi:hypothetical protein
MYSLLDRASEYMTTVVSELVPFLCSKL